MIFVNQFRYPINESIIELPGGFIDPGEQPRQAVERELLEETGYTFSSFHFLGITAANPGVLNNFTQLFLALGGKKTAQQSLDENEEIEIILKTIEEARLMLQHNEIKQSMHALCMFYGFDFMKKNGLDGSLSQLPLL
ncbi:MAG: NUDIX hydrolase [Ferruginibacter sp.]